MYYLEQYVCLIVLLNLVKKWLQIMIYILMDQPYSI